MIAYLRARLRCWRHGHTWTAWEYRPGRHTRRCVRCWKRTWAFDREP